MLSLKNSEQHLLKSFNASYEVQVLVFFYLSFTFIIIYVLFFLVVSAILLTSELFGHDIF